MKIREIKKGEFFTRKPLENPSESQVWIRGEYDRAQKKYECVRFDDANRFSYLKGETQVYTDLVF